MTNDGDSAVHEADTALFSGKLKGLVVACYENERPLLGLAGLLDWRFRGAISSCLQAGKVTGKAGECTYFPYSLHGRTYHILLVGAGKTSSPGKRGPLPQESFDALKRNLVSLRVSKIGVSELDLGGNTAPLQSRNLKEIELEILQ